MLEGANVKLAGIAADVMGRSARLLSALVAGEDDAEALADLAQGRLRERSSG